jgi:hypothetical protein
LFVKIFHLVHRKSGKTEATADTQPEQQHDRKNAKVGNFNRTTRTEFIPQLHQSDRMYGQHGET